MRHFLYGIALAGAALLIIVACESNAQKGERLAKQYCSSCHLFVTPGMLSKKNWEQNVLPQMAFRMGFTDMKIMSSFSDEDLNIILPSLPNQPMVTPEEWEAIKNYYLSNAPDSIAVPLHEQKKRLTQFEPVSFSYPESGLNSLVTLVKTDTTDHTVWVGTRFTWLFELDSNLSIKDSMKLTSPPSSIHFRAERNHEISAMGIMDPNDQPKGSLQSLSFKDHTATVFIDSLKRPVHFEKADLNNDGLDDYIVCAFGNFTGALVAYENKGSNQFEKHILLNQAGARKVIVKDVNEDGLNDLLVLMTQGDEQVALLTNAGDFHFRITGLLRFPPVYGSSYFDITDFNNDGRFDILYTNGDNADYSIELKPYHGVHLFLNEGKNKFKESWSYNLHGASQALARDFDQDGDVDIAVISFFPDFKHAEEGFVYFENTGKSFTPHSTPLARNARWLVMDASDIDTDGDVDLLLGALNFNNGVPQDLLSKWKEERYSLLLLRNNLN